MCKNAQGDEPAYRSGDEALARTPPWSEREEAIAGWPAACKLTGAAVKTAPTSRVSKIFCASKWGRDYKYTSVPRREIIVVRTLHPKWKGDCGQLEKRNYN